MTPESVQVGDRFQYKCEFLTWVVTSVGDDRGVDIRRESDGHVTRGYPVFLLTDFSLWRPLTREIAPAKPNVPEVGRWYRSKINNTHIRVDSIGQAMITVTVVFHLDDIGSPSTVSVVGFERRYEGPVSDPREPAKPQSVKCPPTCNPAAPCNRAGCVARAHLEVEAELCMRPGSLEHYRATKVILLRHTIERKELLGARPVPAPTRDVTLVGGWNRRAP